MVDFPQDIYARNLLSHRGYPLWTPEPNIELPGIYLQEGLKIGDVGVVVPEEGSFDIFFNITLPREHPLHEADGVPNDFAQIKLRRDDYRIVPDSESPGRVILSSTVECEASCADTDGVARRLTDYRFNLHRNEGAMLILPQGAERHRLAKEMLLLDVIINNAVDWYRFARERLYRNITNDALYLITGFHKSQSWSLASFNSIGASSPHCKIVQLGRGGPMLWDDSTWETIHPLEWRIGPRHSNGIPNQSVFIVGFKIAVTEELLHLKRVTVRVDHSKRTLATRLVGSGARLASLFLGMTFRPIHSSETASEDEEADEPTLGQDPPGDECEHVRAVFVPQRSQPFHPSDIINRYLLKKEPSAKIAVTHDSQWIALLERGVLAQQDILERECLEVAVTREYKIVTKSGAVYLQDIDGSTTMEATAAVACDVGFATTTPGVLSIPPPASQPSWPRDPNVPLVQLPVPAQVPFPRTIVVNPTPPMTPVSHDTPSVPPLPSTLPPLSLRALQLAAPSIPKHAQPSLSLVPREPSSSYTLAHVADAGLKPDRHFFLQQSPDDISPKGGDGLTASGKSLFELFKVSSTASSQMKRVSTDADVDNDTIENQEEENEDNRQSTTAAVGAGVRHPMHDGQRKAKMANEAGKRPMVKPLTQRQPHLLSERAEKKGGMFNIGSRSSNGSRSPNSSTDKGRARPSSAMIGHTSKGAAVLPMVAQITAISQSRPPTSPVVKRQASKTNRYMGPLEEQEMEDDGGDDADDKIQMSQSVAQQKLQALMSRQSSGQGTSSHPIQSVAMESGPDLLSSATLPIPLGHPDNFPVAALSMTQSVAQQKLQALISRQSLEQGISSHLIQPVATLSGPGLLSSATSPIPLGHPYNLPAVAPPMMPKTTYRQMLKTELSESMHRQLLWERQVSINTNPALIARRASQRASSARSLASTSSEGGKDTRSAGAQNKVGRRRRAMARNRSWTDDYRCRESSRNRSRSHSCSRSFTSLRWP